MNRVTTSSRATGVSASGAPPVAEVDAYALRRLACVVWVRAAWPRRAAKFTRAGFAIHRAGV